MGIDCPRIHPRRISPDIAQKVVSSERASPIIHKCDKEFELGGSQLEALAIDARLRLDLSRVRPSRSMSDVLAADVRRRRRSA